MLDVFIYQPVVLGFKIEDEPMALYRKYMSRLFEKLMTCKRFSQIRIPTDANAAESGLEPQDYIRRMIRAYDINYDRLASACKQEAARFDGATQVKVHTGSSHEEIARHFARLPKENRIVCELGLGMNPHVTDLCGYSVLDKKMEGTFHIAVGANHMFGGTNKASDHVDFVGRGKVEVVS